jgi:hypothetical protein
MDDEARLHAFNYSIYYPHGWREWDGTIPISGSAYSLTGHASVDASVRPGHRDYELWLWLLPRIPKLKIESISNKDLDRLRPEFEAEMAMNAWTREELLAAIPRRSRIPKLWEDMGSSVGEFLFVMIPAICVVSSVIWLPRYTYRRLRGLSAEKGAKIQS